MKYHGLYRAETILQLLCVTDILEQESSTRGPSTRAANLREGKGAREGEVIFSRSGEGMALQNLLDFPLLQPAWLTASDDERSSLSTFIRPWLPHSCSTALDSLAGDFGVGDRG